MSRSNINDDNEKKYDYAVPLGGMSSPDQGSPERGIERQESLTRRHSFGPYGYSSGQSRASNSNATFNLSPPRSKGIARRPSLNFATNHSSGTTTMPRRASLDPTKTTRRPSLNYATNHSSGTTMMPRRASLDPTMTTTRASFDTGGSLSFERQESFNSIKSSDSIDDVLPRQYSRKSIGGVSFSENASTPKDASIHFDETALPGRSASASSSPSKPERGRSTSEGTFYSATEDFHYSEYLDIEGSATKRSSIGTTSSKISGKKPSAAAQTRSSSTGSKNLTAKSSSHSEGRPATETSRKQWRNWRRKQEQEAEAVSRSNSINEQDFIEGGQYDGRLKSGGSEEESGSDDSDKTVRSGHSLDSIRLLVADMRDLDDELDDESEESNHGPSSSIDPSKKSRSRQELTLRSSINFTYSSDCEKRWSSSSDDDGTGESQELPPGSKKKPFLSMGDIRIRRASSSINAQRSGERTNFSRDQSSSGSNIKSTQSHQGRMNSVESPKQSGKTKTSGKRNGRPSLLFRLCIATIAVALPCIVLLSIALQPSGTLSNDIKRLFLRFEASPKDDGVDELGRTKTSSTLNRRDANMKEAFAVLLSEPIEIVRYHVPEVFRNLLDVDSNVAPGQSSVPFLWHMEWSGSNVVEEALDQCFGSTLALDYGGSAKAQLLSSMSADPTYGVLELDSNRADAVVSRQMLYASAGLFDHFTKGRMVCMFRHPVDRALEQYQDLLISRSYLNRPSLEEFVNGALLQEDYVTRVLSGNEASIRNPVSADWLQLAKTIVRTKCLVGLYDSLRPSIKRVERFFAYDDQFEHFAPPNAQVCIDETVNREHLVTSGLPSVAEGDYIYDTIVERNRNDVELYAFARAVFDEQGDTLFEY